MTYNLFYYFSLSPLFLIAKVSAVVVTMFTMNKKY